MLLKLSRTPIESRGTALNCVGHQGLTSSENITKLTSFKFFKEVSMLGLDTFGHISNAIDHNGKIMSVNN